MATEMTAGDLGREHHGYLVDIPAHGIAASKRVVVLGGIRRWTHEGVDRVGVLDVGHDDKAWRGVEYALRADEPVTLDRLLRKGVPRARKSDYPTPTPTNGVTP